MKVGDGPQFFRLPALNALLVLVILNFTLQPLTEPDFGWHLRTGLDVLNHGWSLPSTDPYSHTMPDWAWVEHAWLTDVIIGALYSKFGVLSVILLFGLIAASAWLMASGLASCRPFFRLLACSLSLWAALPYLGARTQLISLLGLAVLMRIIFQRKRHLWWWIPPLFLLWANLHGGFTAGLFFVTLVIIGTLIVRRSLGLRPAAFHPDEALLSQEDLKLLVIVTALSVVTTLVNPYGWRLHGEILLSLSNQFMLDTLQEWQPLSLGTWAGRGYALYLTGMAMGMLLWYRRIEPVRWIVWAAFLILSLRHMRNIPIFLIVSLPLLADLLEAAWEQFEQWMLKGRGLTGRWTFGATCLTALFLTWLGPDHVQHVIHSGIQPVQYFQGTSYPIEAIEWIRMHRDQVGTRLYNDYAYGGFLLWWLPEEKVFIDGRMPAWQVGERRILQDYVALTAQHPPAISVLQKYSVDWVLVRRNSILDEALAHESRWGRAYEDGKVSIYVLTPA